MPNVIPKKHILFITHRIPYPPNKGDKIRSYNFIKYLAKDYSISLAFLIDNQQEICHLNSLNKISINKLFDYISPISCKIRALVKALINSTSITNQYFYSNKLQKQIDQLIDNTQIDTIFCYSSPTAEYVFKSKHYHGKLKNTKLIMDFIDVDSYKWRQYAASSNFLLRLLYSRESKKLFLDEKKIIDKFHHTILVSDSEKKLLKSYLPSSTTTVIGNGVDLKYFTPINCENRNANTLILTFTGAMDYRPNIDGVSWFAKSIFPKIRVQLPTVEFYIVGRHPTTEVKNLATIDGVTITGSVSDIREYLAKADVCVVPLRIARGIQNKVLEAMAMGKPLICTPEAVEGIIATPGRDLLIAPNAESFIQSTIDLLQDADKKARLGQMARACVERNYSWQARLKKLPTLLE